MALGPWTNQTIGNIKGIRITYKEAAIGAGVIAGIIIAIIVLICAVLYWKRNKVAAIS